MVLRFYNSEIHDGSYSSLESEHRIEAFRASGEFQDALKVFCQ